MTKIEKYKHIILAGAIGDAYGYLVEFDKWSVIQDKYGINGLQKNHLPFDELTISDDTQMTLFCLDAITKHVQLSTKNLQEINEDIYTAYLDWNRTQYAPADTPISELGFNEELWNREAPGHTCLSALGSGVIGRIDRQINTSKGCGGIMRTAPVVFLDLNLENTFLLGAMQAAITHSHEDGYLSAGFFAGVLKCLIEDDSLLTSIDKNIIELKKFKNHENTLQYINKVVGLFNSELIEHDLLNAQIGNGWVGEEALGIALYAMHKGKNFEQVLDISTNHNGDSDSTASLAAQLYIAKNELNQEWFNKSNMLNVINVINNLMNNLEYALDNKVVIKEENKNVIGKKTSIFQTIKNYFNFKS